MFNMCIVVGIRSSLACDGRWADLSCDNNDIINILTANYGRTDTTVCTKHKFGASANQKTDCRASSSLQIVKGKCEGRISCSVQASTSVFGGDPCYGIYKYLDVKYECKAGMEQYDFHISHILLIV